MAGDYYSPTDKLVNSGDTVYADDVNRINYAIDASLSQVSADITVLQSSGAIAESKAWATADQGVRPDILLDAYSSKAYALEAKGWAEATGEITSASTGTLITSSVSAKTRAQQAASSASSADTNATAASNSATTASNGAATAITQAGIATIKAQLASDYANKAEDTQVESGTYSAYHWAKKAQASTVSPVFTSPVSITPAGGLDGGRLVLQKGPTDYTSSGDCYIDLYDGNFRVFSSGGSQKGFSIPLQSLAENASSCFATTAELVLKAPSDNPIFTGTTNCIATSRGSNGFGAFYARGSGTNSSYMFFGDSISEKGRISVDSSGTIKLSNTVSAIDRFIVDYEGRVGIGGVAPAYDKFGIYGVLPSGSNVSRSVEISATIPSTSTAQGLGFFSWLSTEASVFTLDELSHFSAYQGTIGAGSSVNQQNGFIVHPSLIGATNNYGFISFIPAGTGRWNFYANGTARNFFRGGVEVEAGSTTMTSGFMHIPAANGAPTGVPDEVTGNVPMYYDKATNHLYVYNGSWRSTALS